MNENGEIISWRWEPSPQSMRMMSDPLRRAMQDVDLFLEGRLAPVPRNSISILAPPKRESIDLIQRSVGLGLFLEFFIVLFAKVYLPRAGVFELKRGFGHLFDVERPLRRVIAPGNVTDFGRCFMLSQCHGIHNRLHKV
jgi:hypothetical protein